MREEETHKMIEQTAAFLEEARLDSPRQTKELS